MSPTPTSSTLFGINFAPLSIPLLRRLQTFAIFLLFIGPFALAFLNIYIVLTPSLYPYYGVYLVWIGIDNLILKTPFKEGRKISFIRNNILWTYFKNYFPSTLSCDYEIPTNKPIVFGVHPHGMIGFGVWANLIGNVDSSILANVSPSVMTISMNFWIPFFREYLLSAGFIDVGKETFSYMLKHKKSFAIVVGGASEAQYAIPGHSEIIVNRRKGFIKQALLHGAYLVPVFSFGEVDVFEPVKPNVFVSWLQKLCKKSFGFLPILFAGRGIFNYNFGVMPHRRKINVVIGEPLQLPLIVHPTEEEVNLYHAKYVKALVKLHDDNKEKYPLHGGIISELKIVD